MGRGAEQGDVRVSRQDSVSARSCTERLNALYNYAKFSSPSRKGEYYFFSKNDGLQNQSVLYIQKGLNGTPEVLIDPEHVVGGRHRAAAGVRAVEGRQARRLRRVAQRLGLAGIQRAGS